MKTLLILMTLCFVFNASADQEQASNVHDFRDAESIQVGEIAIGIKGDSVFEGRVISIHGDNVELFPLGANFGYTYDYKLNEVSKSLSCSGRICAGKKAIHKNSDIYFVHRVFSNGLTSSTLGFLANTFRPKTSDLYSSCSCLGDICKGDTILSKHGERYTISTLFQNGVFTYHKQGYGNTFRYRLQDAGVNSMECSDESPCSCSK